MRPTLMLLCGLLAIGTGCKPKAGSDEPAQPAVTRTSSGMDTLKPGSPADTLDQEPASPSDTTTKSPRPVVTPGTGGNPPVEPRVTVADILNSSLYNGKTVSVSGICLGYRVPPVAAGGPPRTRSDWQLESEGKAIYVTGPLPSGCSATAGSSSEITISARVQEDTLRALGTNPARSRRYLEWSGEPAMPVRQE